MRTASSAISTCKASRSASEKTATVLIPMRRAVLMMRQAISPRLAIRIFWNMAPRTQRGRLSGPAKCALPLKHLRAFGKRGVQAVGPDTTKPAEPLAQRADLVAGAGFEPATFRL